MLRHNVPVRRDLDQIAADNGFDFHIAESWRARDPSLYGRMDFAW